MMADKIPATTQFHQDQSNFRGRLPIRKVGTNEASTNKSAYGETGAAPPLHANNE
jgi:hypothetical protein